MYESKFRYNITRPYPYRWVTWVVIVGGIAATVLFTFLNVALTGFVPSVEYTTYPNYTETSQFVAWYKRRPWSQVIGIPAVCESQIINTKSRIYTSNHGFAYDVAQLHAAEISQPQSWASFEYHNDKLKCNITHMHLEMQPSLDNRTCPQMTASASVNCSAYNGYTPITMLLNVDLSFNNYTQKVDTMDNQYFLNMNNYSQPSLVLGKRMLEFGYRNLCRFYLANQNTYVLKYFNWDTKSINFNVDWHKSLDTNDPQDNYLSLYAKFRNMTATPSPNPNTYTDPTEVHAGHEPDPIGQRQYMSVTGTDLAHTPDPAWHLFYATTQGDRPWCLNASESITSQMFALHSFTTLFASTLLTDLGQKDPTYNVLATPARAQNFINRTIWLQSDVNPANSPPREYLPGQAPFFNRNPVLIPPTDPTMFFHSLGVEPPRVGDAVLDMRYLCQVPQFKGWGSLIWNVVIGDLILLGALWISFRWGLAVYMRTRKGLGENMDYCDGCRDTIDRIVVDDDNQSTGSAESVSDPGSTSALLSGPRL